MGNAKTTNTPRKASKKSKKSSKSYFSRHRKLLEWSVGILGGIALLLLGVWIAFQVSPWPNALLIRDAFDKNNAKIKAAQEKYVPEGITQIENQQYKVGDNDAKIDVFYRDGTETQLPTIVWVHGGAWVSGNKDNVDNYMKILASKGFTTVSVNYTIAPEKQYPTPLIQLNEALDYLQQNGQRLHADTNRIVMAGDSAGSQIVAQTANMITSEAYAKEIGFKPTLAASKLKGVLLNCGAYDLALPDYNGSFGGFLHTVLWAYSGTKDFLHDPALKTASVVNYLTPQFPKTFITAGNVDPLLNQSTEMAQKLKDLGVPVTTLFYPADHKPELNHEYQFDLDNNDGQQALNKMVEFVQSVTPIAAGAHLNQ
jgi:acetyl esterase